MSVVKHWALGALEVQTSGQFLEHLLRVLISFLLSPTPLSPSENPLPSWDLETPPFPRGNATFRGWGAARGLEGSPHRKKTQISFKNEAQKLLPYPLFKNDCHCGQSHYMPLVCLGNCCWKLYSIIFLGDFAIVM